MNAERATRVVVADDQEPYRRGLLAVLSTLGDIEVVAEAADGDEAVARCLEHAPDVALMDLRMPKRDGLSATAELSRRMPEIHVLVLTTFHDDELVRSALRAGAVGYALKDAIAEHLGELVRMTRRGYGAFAPGIGLGRLVGARPGSPARTEDAERLDRLTARERDVLRAIGEGATNRDIARALYLSEGTVKNHVTRILSEFGLRSRTEAALLVRRLER